MGGASSCASPLSATTPAGPEAVGAGNEGIHGFDFEFGAWRTHVTRLRRSLSNDTTWLEYVGTTLVTPLLGGRANVAELSIEGSAGRIEGVSLRLYSPATGLWSISYSGISAGVPGPPVFGAFSDGVGRFEGRDELNGRPILVRFVIRDMTRTSARFEQSFSQDSGASWELNWVANDERIG
jgi:hypothetical protein